MVEKLLDYLIKGVIVLVFGIPAMIIVTAAGVFGVIGTLVGWVIGLIVTGFIFTKYWKK